MSDIDYIRECFKENMIFLCALNIKYHVLNAINITTICKKLDESNDVYFYVYVKNLDCTFTIVYTSIVEKKFGDINIIYINNSYDNIMSALLNFNWFSKNIFIKWGHQLPISAVFDIITCGFIPLLPKNTCAHQLYLDNYNGVCTGGVDQYNEFLSTKKILYCNREDFLKNAYE